MRIYIVYQIYVYVSFFCSGGGKENKIKKAVNIEAIKQRRKTAKKDAGIVHIIICTYSSITAWYDYNIYFICCIFVFAERAKTANGSFIQAISGRPITSSPQPQDASPP